MRHGSEGPASAAPVCLFPRTRQCAKVIRDLWGFLESSSGRATRRVAIAVESAGQMPGIRHRVAKGKRHVRGGNVEQAGEHLIAQPREQVWLALNDPAVLAQCIEGCRSMTPAGDNRYDLEVAARVGPLRSTFNAVIEVRDIQEPASYRLEISARGGAAGVAGGSASVRLDECDGGTRLSYQASGSVGGKLAQIGSRLVDVAARRMADRFFRSFTQQFEEEGR